jgi:hypothetical protein
MCLKVIAVSLALVAISGCATITRGTSEDLVVRSTPDGAQVRISGASGASQTCAATPCTFALPRRSDVTVLISKDGFKSVRANVKGKLAGFVPLGLVGAAVDVASGAALKLQPNPLVITLEAGVGEIEFVPPRATITQPKS